MLGDVHPGESHAKIIAEIQELDDLTKAEIQRHNAQIPFTRLPEELITYIFLLASSEGGRPLTPLRIGSICHSWRAIAWSASELWSSVTMCLEVQQEAVEIQSDLLEDWLWRAKKRPLSIVVTHHAEDIKEWEPSAANAEALHLVLKHSKQWHSIDLNIPKEWLDCLDKVQGKIPLLERLTIKGSLPFNPEVFSVAPRLRSVAFKFSCYDWEELGEISLPWSQLTELSFTADNIQECLMVVERCSSLVHLTLHENLERPYWTSMSSRPIMINLDGITSLHISSNAEVSSFMDSISAPHLKDVTGHFPLRNPDFLHSLCALITRSGCAKSITRFSFVGHIPSEKEMMLFLSELHNLSELELDNAKCAPPFSDIFINALHSLAPASLQSGSSSIDLPLKLLSIRYLGPIMLSNDMFFDMLLSKYNVGRTGDAPQLKFFPTRGSNESVNEFSCLIQAESLQAQGMKVDMRCIASSRRNS